MSHDNLRKLARHVQHTIDADPSFARPSYQWCLGQVEKHVDAAKVEAGAIVGEGFVSRVKSALVAAIKPLARRPG